MSESQNASVSSNAGTSNAEIVNIPAPRLVQSADRRTALINAAFEVFLEKGYHNAAMDDIAARAGISKPIVYQYFPGKRELYLGLLDDAVAEWVAGISEAVTAESDNRKRVIAAIKYYFDKVDDTDRSYRLIFETDFTADPDVRARVEDVVSQAARIVGVEISQQTNLSSGEANILAAGLCGMAQAAAWRWIKLGRPITKEEAIRGVTYLGWEGLSTFPG